MSTNTFNEPTKKSSRNIWLAVVAGLIGLFVIFVLILNSFFGWTAALATKTVYPDAPQFLQAESCGEYSDVEIPTTEGVEYLTENSGAIIIITAVPRDGYRFPEGPATSWEYDISPIECSEANFNEDGSPNIVAPDSEAKDYVGDVLEKGKKAGSEAIEWTKEYGPGILNNLKEIGKETLNGVEEWAKKGEKK